MHSLNIEQRTKIKITGVVDVKSFDDNIVLMDTEEGILSLKGANLHVSRLSLEKGEADIDGKIDSLIYSDRKSAAKKGESLMKRLLS